MSVTFGCPDASRRAVPCGICDIARNDGWADENDLGGCCCPTCDGTEVVPDAPEMNLANVNAAAVLELLGLPVDDLIGDVRVDELPDLIRKIIKAMNSDRSYLLRAPLELGPGHAAVVVVVGDDGMSRIERRGCRTYVGGVTDEQVVRRLKALLDLVVWAQERGFGVAWD